MWLPSLIGETKLKEMREKGLRLTAEDLYSINQASLKDAIVRFGSGCTAGIISDDGLLLTNHHCGFSQIQSHSSVEHNYLSKGFWAMNRREELPNEGLKVSFLVRMDDVTEDVLKGFESTLTKEERDKIIAANKKTLVDAATENNGYRASVEALYYGNQYFLFVYEDYTDIRLVGAPPSSIGKFAGEDDNWMWPRHQGDFSLFRIYAGKDNKPAVYSPDNVPYKPKKSFNVSLKGVREGDFTFIYGFPGRTNEYLVSDAVEYIADTGNPLKIHLRTLRLNIMNEEMLKNEATRIQYASKASNVANAWKKWQGESMGVKRLELIDRKKALEKRFEEWAKGKPAYENLIPEFRKRYAEQLELSKYRDYYTEAFQAVELTKFAGLFAKVTAESDDKFMENLKQEAEKFFKDYSPVIDKRIAVAVMTDYAANAPEAFQPALFRQHSHDITGGVDLLFSSSLFLSKEKVGRLFTLPRDEFIETVRNDAAVMVFNAFTEDYNNRVLPKYNALEKEILALYEAYMRGLMEMQPDRIFYPDANSTLRIAYGNVAGFAPRDAVWYHFLSTLEGVMEKDNPAVYEYNIPQRLRDIHRTKDFGRWEYNGTVPVNFLASNHTTGGNSGSPVLNGNGDLIGLNFDRCWESTMSDIAYDKDMCRNISVDIRYVVFIVDKIGGAGYLLKEINFVE